jgi:hypothetical protein
MEHPRAAVYRLAHGCGVGDAALYELDVGKYLAQVVQHARRKVVQHAHRAVLK